MPVRFSKSSFRYYDCINNIQKKLDITCILTTQANYRTVQLSSVPTSPKLAFSRKLSMQAYVLPRPRLVLIRNSFFFNEQIQVYETNDNPKTYTSSVRYSRARASRRDILAPRGSTLDFALLAFEKFFKIKTGLEWKDRFDNSKVPVAGTMDDGGPIKPEGGWFMFERPSGIMDSLNVDAERKLPVK